MKTITERGYAPRSLVLALAITGLLAACGGSGYEGEAAVVEATASTESPEQAAFSRHQSRCIRFEFTALGTLGGTDAGANAINDAGTVVGYSNQPGDTVTRAVVWKHGKAVDLGTLGGASSYAYDINDTGKIVGTSATADGTFHATLWSGGKVIDLGLAGGTSSGASSINNRGQIVGATNLGRFQDAVVLWNGKGAGTQLAGVGGDFTSSGAAEINDKGEISGTSATLYYDNHQATVWNRNHHPSLLSGVGDSFAYGMNNKGIIVGVSRATPVSLGIPTVWNGNKVTLLGGLQKNDQGYYQGSATAINDAGTVVGSSFSTANGNAHAVIWRGTEALDLNDFLDANDVGAGWLLVGASGINSSGTIVGGAYNSLTKRTQGFMLTPSVERSRTGGSWDSKHTGRLCDVDL